jgi:hypothetical protein
LAVKAQAQQPEIHQRNGSDGDPEGYDVKAFQYGERPFDSV